MLGRNRHSPISLHTNNQTLMYVCDIYAISVRTRKTFVHTNNVKNQHKSNPRKTITGKIRSSFFCQTMVDTQKIIINHRHTFDSTIWTHTHASLTTTKATLQCEKLPKTDERQWWEMEIARIIHHEGWQHNYLFNVLGIQTRINRRDYRKIARY